MFELKDFEDPRVPFVGANGAPDWDYRRNKAAVAQVQGWIDMGYLRDVDGYTPDAVTGSLILTDAGRIAAGLKPMRKTGPRSLFE